MVGAHLELDHYLTALDRLGMFGRPPSGGEFRTVMVSPEGEAFDSVGCYLEAVPEKRLVFTDSLRPGIRPAPEPLFTTLSRSNRRGRARATLARPEVLDERLVWAPAEGVEPLEIVFRALFEGALE